MSELIVIVIIAVILLVFIAASTARIAAVNRGLTAAHERIDELEARLRKRT
jgi:competence protein ComGC